MAVKKAKHVNVMLKDRKKPFSVLFEGMEHITPFAVIGHYDAACGGADTIKLKADAYAEAIRLHREGYNVVIEGLLISSDPVGTNRMMQESGADMHVIDLDVTAEVCKESIQKRRSSKGSTKEWSDKTESNMNAKMKGVISTRRRLINEFKIPVNVLDRDSAFKFAQKLLFKRVSH